MVATPTDHKCLWQRRSELFLPELAICEFSFSLTWSWKKSGTRKKTKQKKKHFHAWACNCVNDTTCLSLLLTFNPCRRHICRLLYQCKPIRFYVCDGKKGQKTSSWPCVRWWRVGLILLPQPWKTMICSSLTLSIISLFRFRFGQTSVTTALCKMFWDIVRHKSLIEFTRL